MKLILITAVKEFEKNVKEILTKSGVKVFSYSEVSGFRGSSSTSLAENWFASGGIETESLLFTVFADEHAVEVLMERIRRFNSKQEFQSTIHVAALAIENVI